MCQPILNQRPKTHYKTSIRKFSSHTSLFWTLPEQLGTDDTTHVRQPWTNFAKTHHKTSDLRFSSHTSFFWTLPEQLSILHHACVPTHPEDTPQNLRPQDFHLTHPSFELCRSSSPYYTTHVCQPWNNVPKIHHKTSDPKIFISHIPVLNFAGTALHNTPRMWANPSWTNVPRHTTNFNPKIFISHIPVVNFAGTDCTSHVWQPWTNVPKIHHKTSDPKIFISHIPVLTLPEQLSIIHHTCEPTHPSQDTLQISIRKFSSHTSLFWTLPEQLGQITPRMCQPWTNVAMTHHKTSDPKIFISHIPVLNFAWTTRNRWHHACVPTLNQCCKDTPQNLRP